jgi:hypothetical protein
MGMNKNQNFDYENDEDTIMNVKKIFDLNPHKEYFR